MNCPYTAYVYGLAARFPTPVPLLFTEGTFATRNAQPRRAAMNVKTLLTTALAVVVGMVAYQKFVAGKI